MVSRLSWLRQVFRRKTDGTDSHTLSPTDVQSKCMDANEPNTDLSDNEDEWARKHFSMSSGADVDNATSVAISWRSPEVESSSVPSTRETFWKHVLASSRSSDEDVSRSASVVSGSTFYTTRTRVSLDHPVALQDRLQNDEGRTHEIPVEFPTTYQRMLQEKGLWPVDMAMEQNWSGRGQHVEFSQQERQLISDYLPVVGPLGNGASAVVQSVKCRRILLARKTIRCNRRMKRETALDEVAHLDRLKHAHIVRVIGTYVLGNDLSILLYPVADYDLDQFLHEVVPSRRPQLLHSLGNFFVCLSNAVNYLHTELLKHMDIKPTNILVKLQPKSKMANEYRIYITDFGISRSYTTIQEAETEGPTSFTRKYAAPEVVDYQKRGFPADIFPLGCVFVELLTALADILNVAAPTDAPNMARLENVLEANESGATSYHSNIEAVRIHVESLFLKKNQLLHSPMSVEPKTVVAMAKEMIDPDPGKRPLASKLVGLLGSGECCKSGPDELEASNHQGYNNRQ